MKIQSTIPATFIIFATALAGVSFGMVADFAPIYSVACGGVIAIVALGVATLFNSKTKELERTTLPRKLLGLRIGVVGFFLTFGGFFIAVFVSYQIGYIVVGIGIGIGMIGMAIYVLNMLWKYKGSTTSGASGLR